MPDQGYSSLRPVAGFPFPVHASAGLETCAREIAVRCEQAYRFLSTALASTAQIGIVVLAPEHWPEYATYPVYGMPHYLDLHTLIVAGQNNEFWQSMTPPLAALSQSAALAMRSAYGQPDGTIDLSPFFDLLAIHEMAHLFQEQASLRFPRLWLMEFFCNLCLHTYVAVVEPARLPALETFPRIVTGGGHAHLAYHRLEDFERLYVRVGPQNYGWYQCMLHVAAKQVYDTAGVGPLSRLWTAFRLRVDTLSDERLALRLRSEVHPEAERVLTQWPA